MILLKCDICEKTFIKIQSLRNHYIKEHQIIREYQCTFCLKQFPSNQTLIIHKRSKHLICFECDICEKVFKKAYYLRLHLETGHGFGSHKFKCEFCEKRFFEKGTMIRHFKAIHALVESECQRCFKIFSNKDELMDHKRQAHKRKMFECNICHRLTRNKNHIEIVHKGTKLFK